ncbi:MAG: VWA domain-containing protein [Chlorobium phaeobacteroides]|uniref:von Willebrand factor type A n=1 Tax=Chlorobium phaeobacteroides (strain BS1) TaxID=331678 RepID=B3EP83_CHLPB|nr:VWA domain-containing protein [Chlorobium phaeobacteroides]
MENICFAHPERLFLLLLLFPLAGVLGWGLWRKFQARKKLVDDNLSEHLLGGWERGREIAVRMMQFLSTGLLLIALCGPQLCSGEKMVRRDALDMVYLLDVSNSMLARDISPDRLERAREEIVRISRGIERGRRGLVAFAGSGVVQCPLTTDQQAFETMLGIASPDLIEAQGTDISAAMDVAQKMFSGSKTEEKVKAGGVAVLVSDGEAHEKGFSAAARKLKEKDVRLIVVGVGEEEPVVIPLQNGERKTGAVKLDAAGRPVLTSFRPDLLVKLAEDAGGIFLHSRESGFVSDEALNTIETIDRGKQWITEPRYREEIFHYFVLASVLFLLGAGVLNSKQ